MFFLYVPILAFSFFLLKATLGRWARSAYPYLDYLWALAVLVTALVYPQSLLIRITFHYVNSTARINFIICAAFAVAFSRHSEGKIRCAKENIRFILIRPIFAQVLFQGVLLQMLLTRGYTVWACCLLCALLFGTMPWQVSGKGRGRARECILAAAGGFACSALTYYSYSAAPAILLHIIYCLSATLFAHRKARAPRS